MPLSDDQKALLRLLAQREQGYEDIGALMGLSVEQVRGRVREALAALDQEVDEGTPPRRDAEPAAPAPPPRPQADAPAEDEPPSPEAIPNEDARRLHATATEGRRKATERPRGPSESPPAPPRPSRPARPARPSPARLPLPRDRRRLFELVGGVAVVTLFVLFATGLVNIGGGGGSKSSTTTSATSPAKRPAAKARSSPRPC